MAASWYGIARTATIDRAGAWAELDDGGTAKIVTGVTEIGEGILTVLAQIAAEELGVRPEDVTIGDNDTARSPEAAHAGATRQTYMIGNSVALACRDARQKLDAVLAEAWGVDPALIQAFNGEIWAAGTNKRLTMEEAVDLCKKRGVVPVGSGAFTAYGTGLDPVDGSGAPWQAYVFGCQVAEVEVDTLTGEVQVLGVWAVHDVGRAINPRGVEGQIEGGIVPGARPGADGGLRDRAGPHHDARLRQVHPADLARHSADQLPAGRGPRPEKPAGRQGHRRARAGAHRARHHERDLRRHRGAHHLAAGDAREDPCRTGGEARREHGRRMKPPGGATRSPGVMMPRNAPFGIDGASEEGTKSPWKRPCTARCGSGSFISRRFPGIETGEGPIVETLEQICADEFWTAVEVGWMKDYRVRNTARHPARPEPPLGGLRDPAQGAVGTSSTSTTSMPAQRKAAVDAVKSSVDEARQLGAEVVRLIAGKDPGDAKREEAKKLLIDSLHQILDYAARGRRTG
jgi:hypothetical protein